MNTFREDWQKLPFVRMVIPFMLGIFIQKQYAILPSYLYFALALFFILFILSFSLKKYNSYKKRHLSGIFITFFFLFLGMSRFATDYPEKKNFLSRHIHTSE